MFVIIIEAMTENLMYTLCVEFASVAQCRLGHTEGIYPQ